MKLKYYISIIIVIIIIAVYFYPRLTQPPKPIEFSGVLITLQRTACYGTCPAYKLNIHGDGEVIYKGLEFVNVTGTQTTKISQSKIKELIDEFYKIDYFTLKNKYDASITDVPTTITSITIDGKTKKVINRFDAPEKLNELEDKIDTIVNSKMWIENK